MILQTSRLEQLEDEDELCIVGSDFFPCTSICYEFGSLVLLCFTSSVPKHSQLILVRSTGKIFHASLINNRIVQSSTLLVDVGSHITLAHSVTISSSIFLLIAGPNLAPCYVNAHDGSIEQIVFPSRTEMIPTTCLNSCWMGDSTGRVWDVETKMAKLIFSFPDRSPVLAVFPHAGLAVSTQGQVIRYIAVSTTTPTIIQMKAIPQNIVGVVYSSNVHALVMWTESGVGYVSYYQSHTQLFILRDLPNRIRRIRNGYEEDVLVIEFANGAWANFRLLSLEEQSVDALMHEYALAQEDVNQNSSVVDWPSLETRILAVNQALQFRHHASTINLVLVRGAPDYLFSLQLPFALLSSESKFLVGFQQDWYEECFTIMQTEFHLPQHDHHSANSVRLFPLHVFVCLVTPFGLVQQLVSKTFDCLETGELSCVVGEENALLSFSVFNLSRNEFHMKEEVDASLLLRRLLGDSAPKWTILAQSKFRSSASCGSNRIRFEYSGDRFLLNGLCKSEVTLALLRHALLDRCHALKWFATESNTSYGQEESKSRSSEEGWNLRNQNQTAKLELDSVHRAWKAARIGH